MWLQVFMDGLTWENDCAWSATHSSGPGWQQYEHEICHMVGGRAGWPAGSRCHRRRPEPRASCSCATSSWHGGHT